MVDSVQAPFGRIQMTDKDRQLFRECHSESFYYRCIPFATISTGLSYYFIKKGSLKTSAKFGPYPVLVGAAIFGYVVGKWSYFSQCMKKFKDANTPFAEAMAQGFRKKINQGYEQYPQQGYSQEEQQQYQVYPQRGQQQYQVYPQPGQQQYQEYQQNPQQQTPYQHSQDDAEMDYRKVTDSLSSYTDSTPPQSSQPSASYDELRHKNRQSNNRGSMDVARYPTNEGSLRYPEPTRQATEENRYPARSSNPSDMSANKYGDVWDS